MSLVPDPKCNRLKFCTMYNIITKSPLELLTRALHYPAVTHQVTWGPTQTCSFFSIPWKIQESKWGMSWEDTFIIGDRQDKGNWFSSWLYRFLFFSFLLGFFLMSSVSIHTISKPRTLQINAVYLFLFLIINENPSQVDRTTRKILILLSYLGLSGSFSFGPYTW